MLGLSWPGLLLVVDALVRVWSAIGCHDFFTWSLEVFPALVGGAVFRRQGQAMRGR